MHKSIVHFCCKQKKMCNKYSGISHIKYIKQSFHTIQTPSLVLAVNFQSNTVSVKFDLSFRPSKAFTKCLEKL